MRGTVSVMKLFLPRREWMDVGWSGGLAGAAIMFILSLPGIIGIVYFGHTLIGALSPLFPWASGVEREFATLRSSKQPIFRLVKGGCFGQNPRFKFKLFGLLELSGSGTLGIVVAAIIAVLMTGMFILHVG